jgi:hypothetical protein
MIDGKRRSVERFVDVFCFPLVVSLIYKNTSHKTTL